MQLVICPDKLLISNREQCLTKIKQRLSDSTPKPAPDGPVLKMCCLRQIVCVHACIRVQEPFMCARLHAVR